MSLEYPAGSKRRVPRVISVTEAREFVLAHCRTLVPRRLSLSDAVGCVLAEGVTAEMSVPPFTNSAVDGYAVRSEDVAHPPARLRVVGSVMAGDGTVIAVRAGEAVRIMTGAPLPFGTDAACMIEHTRAEAGGMVVVIEEAVDADTNVRHMGEDIASGGEVFPTGTVARAAPSWRSRQPGSRCRPRLSTSSRRCRVDRRRALPGRRARPGEDP